MKTVYSLIDYTKQFDFISFCAYMISVYAISCKISYLSKEGLIQSHNQFYFFHYALTVINSCLSVIFVRIIGLAFSFL